MIGYCISQTFLHLEIFLEKILYLTLILLIDTNFPLKLKLIEHMNAILGAHFKER